MISILPGRPVRCMTSESPSRSPIWLLTIASELLLVIVVSLPVERAYWRQSTAGASRPCRAAMQVQKVTLFFRRRQLQHVVEALAGRLVVDFFGRRRVGALGLGVLGEPGHRPRRAPHPRMGA